MMAVIQIIHILSSILLIVSVLLQGGENVDITAAFGGVSQAAFGPRGSVTLLAKITWGLAVIFIVTSVTLAIHASKTVLGFGAGARARQVSARRAGPAKPLLPSSSPFQPTPMAPAPAKK